ncbi:MAG TPA: ABC transporter substrate-binding protein [Methylomirabilota bacterium]|nr:ABC transporter substrate-binding protein [Methylomirabilota bacterium]
MSHRKSMVLVLAVALGIAIAQPAWGASPKEVLETFFGGANAILRSADAESGTEAPRQAIRALVTEIFDYRDAAARALGPAWQSRTPAEQAEFVRLFADFLERGYLAFVGTKANVSGGMQIRYLEESITGDSAAVATSLLTRNGSDLDVDYFMVRRGGRWMVRDVVVDGMSLIANYRAQFNRILSTSSYAELVARMQGDTLEVPQPTVAAAAPVAPVAPVAQVAPMAQLPPMAQVPTVAPAPEVARAPTVEAIRVSAPEPAIPVQAAPNGASRVAASHYWIQVGAFRTVGAAVQLAERLRRQGMAASNDPLTSAPGHPAGALARVRVGPFATHSDAQSKLRELIARGYAPFIAEARD